MDAVAWYTGVLIATIMAPALVWTLLRRQRRKAGKGDADSAGPLAGDCGRNAFATGAIAVSAVWAIFVYLRPTLSAQLTAQMAAYGWALMGAAWGIATNMRLGALGMRRSIVPALGYGLIVFLSCGLIARTGDFGRLVAPGLFLLMQLPVLLMEKANKEA